MPVLRATPLLSLQDSPPAGSAGTLVAFSRPRLEQTQRFLEEANFQRPVTHLFALRAFFPDAVGAADVPSPSLIALREVLRESLDRLFIKMRLPEYRIVPRDLESAPARSVLERFLLDAGSARGIPADAAGVALSLRGSYDAGELAELFSSMQRAQAGTAAPWAALARLLPDSTATARLYRSQLGALARRTARRIARRVRRNSRPARSRRGDRRCVRRVSRRNARGRHDAFGMTPLVWVALAALVAGALLAAYAVFSARTKPPAASVAVPPATASQPAGEDELEDLEAFEALDEAARCDAAFAAAAHEDAASTRLLERALDDPVEAVALAAAHSLATSGRAGVLDRYVRSHPGARAQRVAAVTALLAPEPVAKASG